MTPPATPERYKHHRFPGEIIRQGCQQCGQAYANPLRRQRPRPGDKWHLDEVYFMMKLTMPGAIRMP
jgi:hypothetical protein